jgi:hypothetical protein
MAAVFTASPHVHAHGFHDCRYKDTEKLNEQQESSIVFEGVALSITSLDKITNFNFVDGSLSIVLDGFCGKISLAPTTTTTTTVQRRHDDMESALPSLKKRKFNHIWNEDDEYGCTPFPENMPLEQPTQTSCPSLSIACNGAVLGSDDYMEERCSKLDASAFDNGQISSHGSPENASKKEQASGSGARTSCMRRSRQVDQKDASEIHKALCICHCRAYVIVDCNSFLVYMYVYMQACLNSFIIHLCAPKFHIPNHMSTSHEP